MASLYGINCFQTRTERAEDSGKTLPTELVSLVVQELLYDRKSLNTCASTCRRWRSIALPFLLPRLCLPDSINFLRAYQFFVLDAPRDGTGIGQSVREIVVDPHFSLSHLVSESSTPVWHDRHCMLAFLRAFPKLKALHCTLAVASLVSSYLPRSSITTLDLHGWRYDILSFTKLLRAAAGTLRSLTLKDIRFPKRNGGKVHTFSPLQMPNVKTLRLDSCDMPFTASLPASVKTLVIQREQVPAHTATDTDTGNLLSTANVVIVCRPTDWLRRSLQHTITRICVPSSIKHLELVLLGVGNIIIHPSSTLADHFAFLQEDGLEEWVTRLHKGGLLERLTITADRSHPPFLQELRDRFPLLQRLGILDIQTESPSVLAPPRLRDVVVDS
ncbi:hypothetical protein PC9H_005709 [Pleurotus ostreatus]|uniref:F-box domain-containing protein n=1 Tax=Pleurotus ostreatus TaxID=5322 RepID=A0A8H7A0F0_PLEOS|nr:uncharacterized protein PC9H_005709 [Pleurotus ostreatus]KAF7433744.1 hypothetical protein PC9H_005709 [Pleurotus ostreatus]